MKSEHKYMEMSFYCWIDVTYFSKFKLYHLNVSPQLPGIEHLYVFIQDIVLKRSGYLKILDILSNGLS